jgi:anti-sigma B factor antagonist
MSLNVHVEKRVDGPLLKLDGELDLAEAPRMEAEVRAIEEEEPSLMVIDLRALRFMDSSGLRTLLAVDRRAREAGRRLVFVPGPEQVQRVMRVTKVDERLEFVEDPATILGEPIG